MSVDERRIAEWRQWIGRADDRTEILEQQSLRRYAAAIGQNPEGSDILPPLAHWAFFLPVAAAAAIGSDGHPARGGLLPPVTFPVRMFAAADVAFHAPLLIGAQAMRHSIVSNVVHKSGRAGDLILVDVAHEITQFGVLRISEMQTILYRDFAGPVAAAETVDIDHPPRSETWLPTETDLFRFSAATFNSHRIHYDRPYATEQEGYPALVVHGPFTAARLMEFAGRRGDIIHFAFRAAAPLFCGQAVTFVESDVPREFHALRCDGVKAMTAKVVFAG